MKQERKKPKTKLFLYYGIFNKFLYFFLFLFVVLAGILWDSYLSIKTRGLL